MKWKSLFIFASLSSAIGTQCSTAADAYFRVKFTDLETAKWALPGEVGSQNWQRFYRVQQMRPYAVLDGEGEVFLNPASIREPWAPEQPSDDQALEFHVTSTNKISGRLFLPKSDLSGMVNLAFTVSPQTLKPSSQAKFLEAEESHYRELRYRNIPGAAWFRYQESEAARSRTGKSTATPAGGPPWRPRQPENLEDTFELFSGGRAISENLQLDRALLVNKPGEQTELLANLTGITVKPMDWKRLLTNAAPATDPLAASIPADQHAIFFRSFQAMTAMLDEADGDGTPLLQLFETRSEDTDCRGRYQRQLCLGLNEISRRLGPQVIDSAAFTGSDPFLRTGTDIGVLFETSKVELLKTFIASGQAAALQGSTEIKSVKGEINGIAYSGVVSPDRAVSSYVASTSNAVFVCNSLYQLGRLIDTVKTKTPALISQDDYLYFRTRYPRTDENETSFLVLPDAAIRRWCSPRWRIANSRRTRAAALLADMQASHLNALVKGEPPSAPTRPDKDFPDAGTIEFTSHGVMSSVYGNLNFLTPIGEMALDRVTKAEATAYNQWRDTYQQNWSQSFDPIAARFSLRPERVGVEVTVMPLILRTEYHELTSLAVGAAIAPGAGDPHASALAHFAMSINTESAPFVQAGGFLGTMSPLIKSNPLGWMGQSLAIFADEDPFWEKLAQNAKKEDFLEKNLSQLPVALHFEVKDQLRLVAFLTALHAYADQSAPGMAIWENKDYNGQPYVKVSAKPGEEGRSPVEDLTIFYAATPSSLTVTMNETVLKHALDRDAAKAAARKEGKPLPAPASPWLGTNVCLKMDSRFITAMQEIIGAENERSLQSLSWDNLPILNEWKHRFPNQDPVKLHEQFWQTKLVCPGGGTYVWNEKWQTMESTVFGHPGEPKDGPKFRLLPDMKDANLGLTFENAGLSAKAIINRTAPAH